MRKKYVILFLSDVNSDQEEALRQMKFSRSPTQQAFDILDLAVGLARLAQIKMDIRGNMFSSLIILCADTLLILQKYILFLAIYSNRLRIVLFV